MVDAPSTPPPPPDVADIVNRIKEQLSDPSKGIPAGGIHAKPFKFAGMYFDSQHASKLWSGIIQSINQSIQHWRAENDKEAQKEKKRIEQQ